MISLHMIVKDEVDNITGLVDQAEDYFDGIFITVSDKKAYQKIKKLQNDVTRVDYRPWNDRFDEARQHNWEKGKDFDASMWLDADDSFDFSTIPRLVRQLDHYDAVFLPYHYEHDDNGNVIVSHWRERLVKRNKGFYWKGWVHENLISEQQFTKTNVHVPVIHQRHGDERKNSSATRNHKILEAAYAETKDPRYIHYLGISHFTLRNFDEAIKYLEEYIEVGGWDEEIYRSLIKMAEAYFLKQDFPKAIEIATRALAYMPEYPMAYHLLAHFEFQGENHKEALEWCKMALSKPTPQNASIYDPTANDRTILTGAMCEFYLGNYREAVELLKQVKTIDTSDVLPEFEHEASIDRLQAVLPALFKHYANPEVLWEGLQDTVKYDPRFRKYRNKFTDPKTWSSQSIVIFCGKGYEEWGPHTLQKGMGGSEEAIVYLSEELANLGYEVTVFGEVGRPFEYRSVQWKPWSHIDPRDEFNTLVIWRYPQFANQFKAKKKLIDMHDLIPKDMVKECGATYLFKSQFHANQYDVSNYNVIPNGVVTEQFEKVDKKPHTVGYFSAYYRGLECLVDMWPKIYQQYHKETGSYPQLDIYYGWQSWVTAEGEDAFYHRMNKKLELVKPLGVTEHGRISHQELAKRMGETRVWAYPTEFKEIFCITAIKANIAGCKPVITDVAALKETGGEATFIETDSIYRDEYAQQKFIKAVVKALQEDAEIPRKWLQRFDWKKVAEAWDNVIKG
jgi:tetratricopeptide (TPR) repeat protein